MLPTHKALIPLLLLFSLFWTKAVLYLDVALFVFCIYITYLFWTHFRGPKQANIKVTFFFTIVQWPFKPFDVNKILAFAPPLDSYPRTKRLRLIAPFMKEAETS